MNIETANRLYEYRKRNNLSQEELAEKIGVSRQAVSKWERAEASPDTDNLIMLAKIYGVSLDTLLNSESATADSEKEESHAKGIHYTFDDGKRVDYEFSDDGIKINHSNSNSSTENANSERKETTDNESNPNNDSKEDDKVSFKHGIHIHSKDGDNVDISHKGVFVNDKSGEKVHIGWDGIHINDDENTNVNIDKNGIYVDENGNQTVYTDKDGNVYVNQKHKYSEAHIFWNKFPYPVISVMAYLLFGFLNICGGWAIGWLVFLTIPLYYSLVSAIFARNPAHFAYPVLVVFVYLWLGMVMALWHPMWVLFLTVPIYYFICDMIKKLFKSH